MLKNKDAHLTLHWQINVPSEKLKLNLKATFQNEIESQLIAFSMHALTLFSNIFYNMDRKFA